MAVHRSGTRGATASVGGTARLLLVVQRGFLLARVARDGARRGGDADRLTPIDIVVDPSAAFSRRSRLRASLASCLALRWSSLDRLLERNRAMDNFFTRRFRASPRRIRKA